MPGLLHDDAFALHLVWLWVGVTLRQGVHDGDLLTHRIVGTLLLLEGAASVRINRADYCSTFESVLVWFELTTLSD